MQKIHKKTLKNMRFTMKNDTVYVDRQTDIYVYGKPNFSETVARVEGTSTSVLSV
jgi:hypothetical protein